MIEHHHKHDIKLTIDIPQLSDLMKLLSNHSSTIIQKLDNMANTLDEVLAATQEESTIDDSIITLLNGISQQLKDALAGEKLSPEAQAKVDQIFSNVTANKQKVADAVTANTPAE